MSDDAKAALESLVKSVNGSLQMTDTVLQSVQKYLVSAVEAGIPVTQDLIKNNTISAEAFQENLKLHKAVVEQTLSAIAALSPNAADDGDKKD